MNRHMKLSHGPHCFALWFPFCLILTLSDGANLNVDTQSFVFASTVSNHSISSDQPDCLLQPEKVACVTLNFILTNILMEMPWINTIFMDNYHAKEPEIIILPDVHFSDQRSIKIICSKPCYLQYDVTIVMHSFQQHLLLHMANITFTNSKISLWNIHIVFKDVQFVNSLVTDWQPIKGTFGHLALHFLKSKFENEIGHNVYRFGLVLNKTFSVAINFTRVELIKTGIHVAVPYTILITNDSHIRGGSIMLSVSHFCFSDFHSVLLLSESPVATDEALLSITSKQLNLTFTHCVV